MISNLLQCWVTPIMWYIKPLLSTGSTHIFLAVCACLIHHNFPCPPLLSLTQHTLLLHMEWAAMSFSTDWIDHKPFTRTQTSERTTTTVVKEITTTTLTTTTNNDDHLWQADAANSVQRKRKLQPNALQHSAYAPLAPALLSCALCAPRGVQHVVAALDILSSSHSTAQQGATVVQYRRIEANCCHELSSLC